MKKIALVGLYSIPNMGDLILCEVSKYLLKEISQEVEVEEVDVCPRYSCDYKGLEYIKYRFSRKMKTIGERRFVYSNKSNFRYRYEYFYWWLRLNRYYRKKLKDVDAIVFAGGGFLKFRTQGLNYYVEQILKIAAKRDIPVMMNGVGIEGYDEMDIRCQKLKAQINKDCVKIITTRDDIDTLREQYVINPNIITAQVGDPALWTPECYHVKRDEKPEYIGINVIRGKIFRDYGNQTSYEELKLFYKKLILDISKKGEKWVLFSNGMESDQILGKEILEELKIDANDKLCVAPSTAMELLNIIKSCKCIFGARLHACITAYSIDVPVVGFIWNEKTRIFAKLIGKQDNFFEENHLEVSDISKRILEVSNEEYDREIRDGLKRKTKQYLNVFLDKYV